MTAPHRPRKRFGQNFLNDPNIIAKLVDFISPTPGDNIVEIGPGQGAMTLPILKATKKLTAIELDRDLVAPLLEVAMPLGELTVHQADILKFNLSTLGQPDNPLRLVGNLPYNISTPILFHLAQYHSIIKDIHIMLQLEVIERLAAAPNTEHFGRLSIMAQYHWQVTPLYRIGPNAFSPPPKVESAFARLVPHPSPPVSVGCFDNFTDIVRAAFSARRKTLRNSLKKHLSAEQIDRCGIDPKRRPETLSLEEFASLSLFYTEHPPNL